MKRRRSLGPGALAVQQFLPGKHRRPPGQHILERVDGHRQRPRQCVERDHAILHADQPSDSVRVRPRRLGSPTSVPISGPACAKPLGHAARHRRSAETANRCGRRIHCRSCPRPNGIIPAAPPSVSPSRRWPGGEFRRWGIDDDQGGAEVSGKCFFEFQIRADANPDRARSAC